MKSAAVPGEVHLAGSWAFTGLDSLRPNAGSADKVWTMYETARQRPCCSWSKLIRALHEAQYTYEAYLSSRVHNIEGEP